MMEHISNFTDILDDEIDDSQPISLPSTNSSCSQQLLPVQNRPPKKTGQMGNFRSIEEIDTKYRHVFTYPYFNLVQSRVIEDALYSDKSMVVCAPTGSGKTVVFEMAIVHLLMELEDKNYSDDYKIIYMAPVKALCTERLTEWYPKFNKLGLLCIEVTGDTDVDFPQLKPYRIIITTPEKWDMLTRRWKDYRSLVEVVKLFLIDEVHILNDEIRGPVLEAVVSRMKTIESSAQSAHRIEKLKAQYQGTNPISNESEARIRFIAISATVSNPEDVATWLGTADRLAVYYKFGDECRPVKLKRVVEGYPCADGTSIFKFDIILNYKLWPIIQKYHNGKPTLIFCNTRKSVVLTAETLSKEITVSFSAEQKMKLTTLASTIKNKKIQSLVLCGVGCHHAGLLFEERMNIERAFRNRDLPILITTTTLAMGVNLPAHLVIIKNTQQYVNGAYQEYSISTILQMVGRAGRPQYDTEATAVIMTRSQDKARYQALVDGSEPLQSYLHKRLAENLNSEAALGTVGDVAQCVQWLNSTFLCVRAARDPKRYLGLPHAAPAHQISKKIEELCVKAMNCLASAGLITMDEASCIESTEAGRLMSVYYLDLETMKLIMKLEGSESLERLLWLICESHELSDMHLRVDERRCLNSLNRNNSAATIRYPMKGKINSRQMKLNCIIQAVLGCLHIPDPSLNQEAMKIMRIADRVCKCLVSYITRPNLISQNPKFYTAILNSLILAKCISANLWENSPYVSRQLKGIGPTFSALLASAGKVNFMLLEESHPRDLERIMNKGPPAGNILRKQISLLPKYNLTATPINERTVEIKLSLLNHAFLAENVEHLTAGINHKSHIIVGDSENYLLYFTHFKESDLVNVYDGCMTFNITRKHSNEQKIFAHCISTSFVGIDEQCQYLFKDLFPERIENPQYLSTILSKSPTQLESYKLIKERKRKSQNDNEIIQSKEKRKRESDLITKLKFLKDSFGKTSKEIKVNLNKTAEMSNKVLQNLTEQSGNKIANESEYTILSDDSFQNAFQEEFECDDFADDKHVNDILDDIEKEIKSRENTSDFTINEVVKPRFDEMQYDKKYSNMTYTISKTKCVNGKRKLSNKQNNYNFIDMLEKKLNLNGESDIPEVSNKNGFNDAVKLRIEKYLENTTKKNSAKTNTLDLKESDMNVDHQAEEEVMENYNKQNNIIIIHDSKENSKSNKDLELLKQRSESHLNKDKIVLNKTIIDLEEPIINFDYQEVKELRKTYHKDDDIITTSHTTKVIKQKSEFDLNSEEIIFNTNCIDLEPVVNQQVNIDVTKTYNKDVITINEVPRHDTEIDLFKKDEIVLWDHTSFNERDKSSGIIDLTNNERNNLNLLLPKNKFIFKGNENELIENTTVESYEKNNAYNIVAEVGKFNVNNSFITLPKYQKINLNSSINTMSIVNSNELQKLQYFQPFSNLHNNKIITPLPGHRGLMASCTNDNALDINFNDQISNKEKPLEYIKRHRLRKTNYFDTTTENTRKQKIQLIGKLEINLDVTEIVLNNSDNNEVNSKQCNTSNEENSECISNNNIDKNELILKQYESDTVIQNTNYNIHKQNVKSHNNNENEIFKDSVDSGTTLLKPNPTVNDILQKYNHIVKRQDNNNIQYEQASLNEKTKEQNSLRTYTKPKKRKYKISDLEKIQIDLPETLITKSQGPETFTAQYNINQNLSKNNNEVEPKPDVKFQSNISSIQNDIEDIDTYISSKLISEDLIQSDLDFDVSEAILNPKMLLQSMRNNMEDIIPPPPEFCDDPQSTESHEDKMNMEYDMLKSQDNKFDNDQLENIFFENTELDLTPSKEIETWSLSPGVEPSDVILNPNLSYTVMHKNVNENKSASHFLSSRRAKLSEFKFKRKNIFRK